MCEVVQTESDSDDYVLMTNGWHKTEADCHFRKSNFSN